MRTLSVFFVACTVCCVSVAAVPVCLLAGAQLQSSLADDSTYNIVYTVEWNSNGTTSATVTSTHLVHSAGLYFFLNDTTYVSISSPLQKIEFIGRQFSVATSAQVGDFNVALDNTTLPFFQYDVVSSPSSGRAFWGLTNLKGTEYAFAQYVAATGEASILAKIQRDAPISYTLVSNGGTTLTYFETNIIHNVTRAITLDATTGHVLNSVSVDNFASVWAITTSSAVFSAITDDSTGAVSVAQINEVVVDDADVYKINYEWIITTAPTVYTSTGNVTLTEVVRVPLPANIEGGFDATNDGQYWYLMGTIEPAQHTQLSYAYLARVAIDGSSVETSGPFETGHNTYLRAMLCSE